MDERLEVIGEEVLLAEHKTHEKRIMLQFAHMFPANKRSRSEIPTGLNQAQEQLQIYNVSKVDWNLCFKTRHRIKGLTPFPPS